ncbi:MAG: hypothetical protein WA081_20915 [Desulfosalsimonadaceae bacterium]
MKKLLFGILFIALVPVFSVPTIAGVNVGINISAPPDIAFEVPPEMIVIPETYVYAVPDADTDMFFHDGWWWRPWEGRWYQSRNYDSGWKRCQTVPAFYKQIPPGWRNDYKKHHWKGHQWNYQRIPHKQVQQNWNGWKKNKHWETQQYWGVEGLHPRTRSQQNQKADPQNQKGQPQQSHQQQGKHQKGK